MQNQKIYFNLASNIRAMIIKPTKELHELAKLCQITSNELSDLIIEEGIKGQLFKDEPDYWGYSIEEHRQDEEWSECSISIFCLKCLTGIYMPSVNQIELIRSLITIGDGDCPECGGDLQFHENIYECLSFGGTPTKIATDVKCNHCGEIKRIKE